MKRSGEARRGEARRGRRRGGRAERSARTEADDVVGRSGRLVRPQHPDPEYPPHPRSLSLSLPKFFKFHFRRESNFFAPTKWSGLRESLIV